MTPERMRECLSALGWSQRALAARLGLPDRSATVRQWCNGHTRIPEHVAAWLEHVAAPIAAQPLPPGWQIVVETQRT
jgi:transcriptional regulator with XRE-family HTH domain